MVPHEGAMNLMDIRNRIAHGDSVGEQEAALVVPIAKQLTRFGYRALQRIVAGAWTAVDIVEAYVCEAATELLTWAPLEWNPCAYPRTLYLR